MDVNHDNLIKPAERDLTDYTHVGSFMYGSTVIGKADLALKILNMCGNTIPSVYLSRAVQYAKSEEPPPDTHKTIEQTIKNLDNVIDILINNTAGDKDNKCV